MRTRQIVWVGIKHEPNFIPTISDGYIQVKVTQLFPYTFPVHFGRVEVDRCCSYKIEIRKFLLILFHHIFNINTI